MKTASFVFCVLLSVLPLPLRAQDSVPPAAGPPPIPSMMAERELARSRRCVPAIARFTALQQEIEPLYQRANRIQALNALLQSPGSSSPEQLMASSLRAGLPVGAQLRIALYPNDERQADTRRRIATFGTG